MNGKKRIVSALLLGAALFGAGPGRADAAIIITPVAVGTPAGSNFMYTYTLTLAPDSLLLPPAAIVGDNMPGSAAGGVGDRFTLYDIFGLVPGSVTVTGLLALPGNTAVTTQNVGVVAPATSPLPADNPAVLNINVAWLGGSSPAVAAPPGTNVLLGTITFLSTNPVDLVTDRAFTAASQQFVDPTQISNNVQQFVGPGSTPPSNVIPAPAGLILAATALPFVGALRRRLRKTAA